jgi:hypothetical protein
MRYQLSAIGHRLSVLSGGCFTGGYSAAGIQKEWGMHVFAEKIDL